MQLRLLERCRDRDRHRVVRHPFLRRDLRDRPRAPPAPTDPIRLVADRRGARSARRSRSRVSRRTRRRRNQREHHPTIRRPADGDERRGGAAPPGSPRRCAGTARGPRARPAGCGTRADDRSRLSIGTRTKLSGRPNRASTRLRRARCAERHRAPGTGPGRRAFSVWKSRAGATDDSSSFRPFRSRSIAVSRPCNVHQWDHYTEPCPYCREINSEARSLPAHASPPDESRPAPHGLERGPADRLSQAIVAACPGTPRRSGSSSPTTSSAPAPHSPSCPATSSSSRSKPDETLTDVEVVCAPLDVADRRRRSNGSSAGIAGCSRRAGSGHRASHPGPRGSPWPSSTATRSARSGATGTTFPAPDRREDQPELSRRCRVRRSFPRSPAYHGRHD